MRKMFATMAALVLLASVIGPSTPAAGRAALPPIDISQHLKIMGVGDSITEGGWGCCSEAYRAYLWHNAWEVGHFYTWSYVGPRKTCPTCWSHAGQSGQRLDQMDANLTGWQNTYQPDVILLHGGIGELLQGMGATVALQHMTDLLTHALAAQPTVRIVVGDLMPPWGNTASDIAAQEARRFNAGLPAVISAAGPRVSLARMSVGVSSRWLADGLHPLPRAGAPAGDPFGGWARMAWVWWMCLGPILVPDGHQRGGEDPNEVPIPVSQLCPA